MTQKVSGGIPRGQPSEDFVGDTTNLLGTFWCEYLSIVPPR